MRGLAGRLAALTLALGLVTVGGGAVQVATAEPAQAAYYTQCQPQYRYWNGVLTKGALCYYQCQLNDFRSPYGCQSKWYWSPYYPHWSQG